MLLLGQLALEPVLFQFMHGFEQFHLLVLEGLQLNPYLFSYLHVLSLGDILIVQDVDVSNSFSLEIAVQLGTPICEERIPGTEQLIRLFL